MGRMCDELVTRGRALKIRMFYSFVLILCFLQSIYFYHDYENYRLLYEINNSIL